MITQYYLIFALYNYFCPLQVINIWWGVPSRWCIYPGLHQIFSLGLASIDESYLIQSLLWRLQNDKFVILMFCSLAKKGDVLEGLKDIYLLEPVLILYLGLVKSFSQIWKPRNQRCYSIYPFPFLFCSSSLFSCAYFPFSIYRQVFWAIPSTYVSQYPLFSYISLQFKCNSQELQLWRERLLQALTDWGAHCWSSHM